MYLLPVLTLALDDEVTYYEAVRQDGKQVHVHLSLQPDGHIAITVRHITHHHTRVATVHHKTF